MFSLKKHFASLFFCIIVLGSMSCSRESSTAEISIRSFRDVPGITNDEIEAIEALQKKHTSFVYGMLRSADTFVLPDGSYAGFTPLLCELLSDLFGIPFVPQIYDWQELKNNFAAHTIDFTGTINATADLERQYFRTSPIAENKLSVFVKDDDLEILSEYDLRGLKIGFFSDSSTEQITRNTFTRVDFESVAINTTDEMAEKLLSGEIDAFIFDTADVFTFYEYSHVVMENTFPYVYVPASISTANPQLEPVISVITKYLMTGGIKEVERLYSTGEQNYARYVLDLLLNENERMYIAALAANGEKVPIGVSASRYPVAFFDEESKEFQGIALDVLEKISLLTGIEFHIVNDRSTVWSTLEDMLRDGEIALLSQLVQNNARREYAIWPDTHYFTSRYAFLSNLDFPFLSINQVPYANVGTGRNTTSEAMYRMWFPEDTRYKTYNGSDEGLDALEKGEIDLYLTLDYTLLYESNYRKNAGQKINILFDSPVEKVLFGLNKNEEILCSIISKAQRIINTERIVRNWTSRSFDQSALIAMERVRFLTITVICLLVMLGVMFLSILISIGLRKTTVESRQNLQTLIDMMPVGVRILSLDDWTLLYSNQACLSIFGCTSQEQAEGRSGLGFMPEVQPDGRTTAEHLNDIFKNEKAVAEVQCLKLDGEPFTCRMTSSTINYTDRSGRGHRASLAVMEDVTAEEEYRKMLRNTALREQEANQLKTQFLTTMSHEIRTPMNAILGIAEIQLQNEDLSETTEDAFVKIYDSGNLLLNIINDILDFSKIEAGKLEIVPVKYDVPSLLNDTVQLNRLRYESKPIDFKLTVDEDTPFDLYGDEYRIKQILNNLLSNSFKYTSEGSIGMSVAAEKENNKETVTMIFTVRDTGQGMTGEQLSRLFEEYSRFNTDKNHGISGTGLGMSITKRLIEMMEGEIIVESEKGMGSSFTVRLPQRIASTAVCGPDLAEKLQNFSFRSTPVSKRSQIVYEYMPYGSVLIVDDVASNLYVSRGLLMPYGLQIETAESGMEAIEKIKNGNVYDIIFMDHMMPIMNGIETTKILRNIGYTGYIVALTANAVVGQAQVFLENGFNGFISKPIDTRELNLTLNEFIRNKKPPEVVKAARLELKNREKEKADPMENLTILSEMEELFVMDAENAITMLKDIHASLQDTHSSQASDDVDFESYITIVHGIKSALANINEKELSAFALKLEKAGEEQNIAVMSEETPQLIDALQSLVEKFSRSEKK